MPKTRFHGTTWPGLGYELALAGEARLRLTIGSSIPSKVASCDVCLFIHRTQVSPTMAAWQNQFHSQKVMLLFAGRPSRQQTSAASAKCTDSARASFLLPKCCVKQMRLKVATCYHVLVRKSRSRYLPRHWSTLPCLRGRAPESVCVCVCVC